MLTCITYSEIYLGYYAFEQNDESLVAHQKEFCGPPVEIYNVLKAGWKFLIIFGGTHTSTAPLCVLWLGITVLRSQV